MNKLSMYSEEYSPTGNAASKGVLNQLGRPKLDLLAVLVREAVQNSWDAREKGGTSIEFGLAGWTLSESERRFLEDKVFPETPPELNLGNVLHTVAPLRALAIYDRGTLGLGGPTRADTPVLRGENYDFVDFMRNVGQPPDKQWSGGTYGFGKAVFYRMSLANTVVIHTRCRVGEKIESRFMASALGGRFEDEQSRYTGRHWWGEYRKNVIEPILDNDADTFARRLGLPDFDQDECGTTILMIQPDFSKREPLDALSLMSEFFLWYCWPKLLDGGSGPAIRYSVSCERQTVPVPHPSEYPPLHGFVQAMQRLKSEAEIADSNGEVHDIFSTQYNRQRLGRLALERFVVRKRPLSVDHRLIPIQKSSHHIALMRQPELIVKYLKVKELPSSQIEFAGVFLTEPSVDKIFADAEPPTHEDWTANILSDWKGKVFVNTVLKTIKQRVEEFVRLPRTQTASGDLVPLGSFANELGMLLPGQVGTAAFADLFSRRRSKNVGPAIDTSPIANTSQKPASHVEEEDTEPLSGLTPAIDTLTADGWGRLSDKQEFGLNQPVYPTTSNNNTSSSPGSVGNRTDKTSLETDQQPTNGGASKKHIRAYLRRYQEVGELLLLPNNIPAARFGFDITFDGPPSMARVRAQAGVLLDNDEFEIEPPEGSEVPIVLYWIDPSGAYLDGSSTVEITSEEAGIWYVLISVPDDSLVGVNIDVDAVYERGQ